MIVHVFPYMSVIWGLIIKTQWTELELNRHSGFGAKIQPVFFYSFNATKVETITPIFCNETFPRLQGNQLTRAVFLKLGGFENPSVPRKSSGGSAKFFEKATF